MTRTRLANVHRFPVTETALRWLETILEERFGHAWQLSFATGGLVLSLKGEDGAIFFDFLIPGLAEASSDQPCATWIGVDEGWTAPLGMPLPAPGAAKLPSPLIEAQDNIHSVHYDILGFVYWALSRIEEIDRAEMDQHSRFPATASHAYRNNYLDRPVVDEWLNILGQVIQRQWPSLKLKRHEPRFQVTCDLDRPFLPDDSLRVLATRAAADLVKRRSTAALWTLGAVIRTRLFGPQWDPFREAIEYIMTLNELAGRKVMFYLMSGCTESSLDCNVALNEPRMQHLIREIDSRGHDLGLHPGYETYKRLEPLDRCIASLNQALLEAGVKQRSASSRQHYLRWNTPLTARLLSDAGILYDSSLAYADCAGFRCGTCFEYPFFDAEAQRAMHLRERPLILMEASVLSDRYQGLGYTSQAEKTMLMYRDRCAAIGGTFNLLWHNCHLVSAEDRRLYEALITEEPMLLK